MPEQPDRTNKLIDFLRFWQPLPKAKLISKDESMRFEATFQTASPEVRTDALTALQRQYAEVKEDVNSVRSRAGNLLAATGVISGVVALSSAFASPLRVHVWLGVLELVVTFGVLYSAVGAAFLAIRAQQVDYWGQAALHPEQTSSPDVYAVDYAKSLYVIWRDNVERLKLPVGYLRDAQVYFQCLIVSLGVLVLLIVAGNFSVPASTHPAMTNSRTTSPSPARSPH